MAFGQTNDSSPGAAHARTRLAQKASCRIRVAIGRSLERVAVDLGSIQLVQERGVPYSGGPQASDKASGLVGITRMYCQNCGAAVAENASRCGQCGRPPLRLQPSAD